MRKHLELFGSKGYVFRVVELSRAHALGSAGERSSVGWRRIGEGVRKTDSEFRGPEIVRSTLELAGE